MRARRTALLLSAGMIGACVLGAGPETQPTTTRPVQSELAGSSSCRTCHAAFYEKWSTSHHGLAMRPFDGELAAGLKPPTTELNIRGQRYRVELSGDAGWVIEQGAQEERRYPIAHALGGKNVYYFLTPLERGRLQVLPVAYDVQRQTWIDTTGSAVRGLMHFDEEVLDWRAPALTFNTSCYGCHVSQFSSNYDRQTDSYHSTWAEPGISCETCHGPAAAHVALFRDLPAGKVPDDPKIISTKKFSVEQLNASCAPCHAKAIALTSSFAPGARFFDNYDVVGLEHSDYYPDGRDLGENYTYTSWQMSPCVKSGQLSCMHCHTSSGRFRFADDSNAACLPCHQDRVEHAPAHTHHEADSVGNRCTACHMPMTEFARMRRSDHSMRPPMPAATLAFKSPNACNQCHADKDAAWADALVRQWHQPDYQAATVRVGKLVEAARHGDWTRLPEMLAYILAPDREETFAAGLVRLLRGCEDARKWPALLKALEDRSPLVRSSAADGLSGYSTPEATIALLAATRDDYRLVRVRAAATLAGLPREGLAERPRRDLERATTELLALSEARPDDSAAQHNLGNFYMARQEYDRASACFERAFELAPDNAAPLVNAALVHNAAGNNEQAEDCLRRALKVEPRNAAAWLNLGLLFGEMDRPREAEAALRAAFEADPQAVTAARNLAVMLAADRPPEALDWARKAAQLRPQDAKCMYVLAYCERQNGDADGAINTLRTLLKANDAYLDAYAFLGGLYEERQQLADAVALYRQAANNAGLPAAARDGFAARAEWLARQ